MCSVTTQVKGLIVNNNQLQRQIETISTSINNMQKTSYAAAAAQASTVPSPSSSDSSSGSSTHRSSQPTTPDELRNAISSVISKNKKGIMSCMIDETQPDIMIITETWLSPDILNSEIFPRGYSVFRKDRADGFGGVLIACRNGIICSDVNIDSPTEMVACKVTLENQQSVIICSVYRPPDRNFVTMDNLCHLRIIVFKTS